ncbi:hypothetical protein Tco_1416856 [Tanacetum coccineum]
MPYYPNFRTPFVNPDELSLFNQWKMQQQMRFNEFSQQQQQQPNQSTASQLQSDHQSFNLIDETEDENKEEPIPTLTSKKTSRGQRLKAKAKKNQRYRITSRNQETSSKRVGPRRGVAFGGKQAQVDKPRIDKRKKKSFIKQESEERRQLIHAQRIAEEMRVLQIDTCGMDPADAIIINAQKARIRAAYQPPPN